MKMFPWRLLGVIVAGACGALPVACAAPTAAVPTKPAPAGVAVGKDVETLSRQLREAIGEPRCTASEQCKTMAVGHKACGGPETYVVWSTVVTDGGRLRALADAYTEARRKEGEQAGRVSDCALVTDPGARCEAQRCVPAGRSPAVM